MSLPVRLAQALVNAAWRATHWNESKAVAGSYPVPAGGGGWWPVIREPYTGAWQRNVEIKVDTVLTYSAVFRCISLISSDIAKMRIRLVAKNTTSGIWQETENAAHSPVLRKPNRFQTRIQFFESWVVSKLVHGNTYILKQRDARRVVTALYVLDPSRVTVLISPDGDVSYDLRMDNTAGLQQDRVGIPASELIHDRWNTLHHPLIGTSPIYAAGLAAAQGLSIQNQSTRFFANGNRPGGVVTAPGDITPEKVEELKRIWNNRDPGTTAILTGGMQYVPISITATDAQMIEQLKWSAETVASVFGVPAYMIGIGAPPTYNNIEALNAQYYSQCLQRLIEDIELLLDEGLELKINTDGRQLGTEFDLDDLLRMDSKTQMEVAEKGVKSAIYTPDEARAKFDLPPVPGGNTPYMQEQNWPLRHLAERPLPTRDPTPPAEMPPNANEPDDDAGEPENSDDDAAEQERERAYHKGEILRRSKAWHGRPAA